MHDPNSTSDRPLPGSASTSDYLPDEGAGTKIGPYKLLQQLGKGGMGVVWMADQTEPVQRRVALKIIKSGMDSDHILARFEAERQALAMMDHPNIAKVLDAGTIPPSPSGREVGGEGGGPYFVMELVKGIPFTKYCDQEHLTPKERLELFIPVCNAVQHAHQKGIIHRDLKPSNVLIALYDGKAVPKVIDFGIAKAMHQKLTERTMFTEVGQIVGTLEYMAPEQAELNNLDIDTRADIYSLGVMLYELLTGSAPFSSKQLRSAGYDEMRRLIREVEPPKPSTRLSSSDELPSIAAKRKLEPKKLTGQVQGDLDWIVMKCLEKDRIRRYETANQLGQELQRFLADEPVQAGPPSVGYRAKKFIRRNKGPVFAAGMVLAVLVLGVIGTSIGFFVATRAAEAEASAKIAAQEAAAKEKTAAQKALDSAKAEKAARDDAEKAAAREKLAGEKALAAAKAEKAARDEADKAADKERRASAIATNRLKQIEKVNAILESIFTDIDPRLEEKGGPPLIERLTKRLVAVADKLDPEAIDDPLTFARLRHFLGSTLLTLGEWRKAIELHEQSWQTRAKLLGTDHPDTLYSMASLAWGYLYAGKLDLALPLLEETLDLSKARLGPDHPNTLSYQAELARGYMAAGKLALALPLLEETLKLQKVKLGPDDPNTLTNMNELARGYLKAGKVGLALPLFEETYKLSKAKLGPDHLLTVTSMANLAQGYRAAGKLDLALPLYEETLKLMKAIGPDHNNTLTCMNNLATGYHSAGKLDLALPLYTETLKLQKAKLGPDHPATLNTMNNLAMGYQDAGKLDLALPLFEETLNLRKAKLGPDHPETLGSMNNLAAAYWRGKQLDKSIPLFEETLRLRNSKLGRDHPETLRTAANLGVNYRDAGRLNEAIPLLEEAQRAAKKYPALWWVGSQLLDVYAKAGENVKLANLLQEQLSEARKTLPKDSPQRGGLLAQIGMALLVQKQWTDAERLLRECLDIRKKNEPDAWSTFNTKAMLGASLLGQKKYQDAEPLLKDGYEGMKAREKTMPPQALPRLTEALECMMQLYDATGNAAEADRYRKELAARKGAQKEPKK